MWKGPEEEPPDEFAQAAPLARTAAAASRAEVSVEGVYVSSAAATPSATASEGEEIVVVTRTLPALTSKVSVSRGTLRTVDMLTVKAAVLNESTVPATTI